MDKHSAEVPLLALDEVSTLYTKASYFKIAAKWILKLLMWLVFTAWIALMFFYPSEIGHNLTLEFMGATQGTLFGLTGSIFLAFTSPLLIIACLAFLYLILSGEEEILEKKAATRPAFRLWTFPVLVSGPFGVVSAAEFIGILLVAVFVIYGCVAYAVQSWSLASQSQLSSFEKSCLMLEQTGTHLGLIGVFCCALLFVPISRGSVLLRIIDIPFQHATRYHVWLGHLMMWLFTLHGLFHVVVWGLKGHLVKEIIEWKSIGVAHFAGVISLSAGVLMWVTSLEFVRKWNFELFLYTHQLYIVFVIFLALHAGDFIFCMGGGGIFLFILDRFLRFIQSRKTVDIISATALPCGTIELVLSKPANIRYNALSFIFLQVRELSWLQWHPFSVSSSPLDGKHHLAVLIKDLGNWTEKLKLKISDKNDESQKLQQSQIQSLLTASVEGPFGHESPYYLTYKHLILVAGGIGVSPFLAILSDIFHRLKDGKPCMPRNILIVWAIKRSDELALLSVLNLESIKPVFFDSFNLEIQVYVTGESEPKLEEGKAFKAINSSIYPTTKRSGISVLVGTGNNMWAAIYVIASSIGLVFFQGLLDVYYINSHGIETWWYKGLLVFMCMVASVVFVGGLVVALWHLWDRRISNSEETENDFKKNTPVDQDMAQGNKNTSEEYLFTVSNIHYGFRPDLKENFASMSERWGAVDVGVVVCGPPTLKASVAKEIRSHSLSRNYDHPIFHFNSHTFDL